MPEKRPFLPLNIAILTVSNSRDAASDNSGNILVKLSSDAGHTIAVKRIVKDNIYQIRAIVAAWIADDSIDVILSTGGTGVTGSDGTPEAVAPLLDKQLEGFGELFRMLSYEEIGASTIASRAIGGVANGSYVFCLPGSSGACRTGWNRIIVSLLDNQTKPCNLAMLIPRLREI
jgi:molybdenum cofactor biosynthesis protein B